MTVLATINSKLVSRPPCAARMRPETIIQESTLTERCCAPHTQLQLQEQCRPVSYRTFALRLDVTNNNHAYPTPRILLVENDPDAAHGIRSALAATVDGSFDVEWVRKLSESLTRMNQRGIDAVLLNLCLPDCRGLETFDKLFIAAPDVPILILGGNDNEAFAKQAVERGAQDYLQADHSDSYSLQRALRTVIERKVVEDALYEEKERNLVTLNSIGDAVLCSDIS